MIAKRRQFSESHLSCEAMSETNKYSFKTLLQHISLLAINPFLLLWPPVRHVSSLWWTWKERQLRNKANIARQPSTFLFGALVVGVQRDFGLECTGKMFEFHYWIVTNNKQQSRTLWTSRAMFHAAMMSFIFPMKNKLNDKEQRFPE